jgi:uncharacterized protein (DUF488 family)
MSQPAHGVTSARPIYTIGHSTHPIETFIEMLGDYRVECLIDVRTIPKSRHNPQFGQAALASKLAEAGIDYCHMNDLGGLRKTTKGSVNGGWRNASFRGYADYMQTDSFKRAVERLIAIAESSTVALMCAEAVPWRCHRSLIGDALVVRGRSVTDIFSSSKSQPHRLTSFAKVDGSDITYPPERSTA